MDAIYIKKVHYGTYMVRNYLYGYITIGYLAYLEAGALYSQEHHGHYGHSRRMSD